MVDAPRAEAPLGYLEPTPLSCTKQDIELNRSTFSAPLLGTYPTNHKGQKVIRSKVITEDM